MVAEIAVLVTIATSMASGQCNNLLQKSIDALAKIPHVRGLKSVIVGSLKSQLLELNFELSKLNALTLSAESLSVQKSRNELLLLWLGRVKEAANFADNMLDQISYDQLRRQVESHMVVNLLSGSYGSFAFRLMVDRELSKFRSMTDEIYKEAAEIGLRPVEFLVNSSNYQPPAVMSADLRLREVRENVDTSIVVGRQFDEDLIVRKLCRLDNNQVFGVIAIVGMSGVGKTTLARKIYDNETVTQHYKKKTWIFVSEDFNLRRILNEMLQSVTGDNHNLSNIDTMEKKLQRCLEKETYLLVLDGVWNTDQQIWDSIRTSLDRITQGCSGSMVLVTTQIDDVASVMGASLTRVIRPLSNRDAWTLFEIKAFANKSQQQVSDLTDIGRRILRKCGGLPLALNTLGSLLGSMQDRSQWESVERSQVWNLSEGQTKIMPWLLLSFRHLPSAIVKRCFAHCSVVIPKGGSIGEGPLTNCWVAQGFIQPLVTTNKTILAIGQTHIKSLLANGLLQWYIRNNVVWYFMHDLIHDLAVYVSRDTCLNVRGPADLQNASSGVEHVRIHGGSAWKSQLNFPAGNVQSTLRTLICVEATISIDLVSQARFLRHLQLRGCGLKEIPSSIGRLKHLRNLDLYNNPFEYLPASIGKLYNLQVLTLKRCHRLVELPQQLTRLLNLRVIETTEAMHIPKGIGKLTYLEQLPILKLEEWEGCKLKELRNLLNLGGKVVIKQLENISCKQDAVEANLETKEGITHLNLVWTSEGPDGDIICSSDREVMQGLRPHSNLKSLQVENFRGKEFPRWLSDGIYCNNLTRLHLLNCKRCKHLPTLGCLPSLKSLSVDKMESIEIIGSDFFYTCDQRTAACSSSSKNTDTSTSTVFPRLNQLSLSNMCKLKDWFDPSGSCASAFPYLTELCIINCPLLVSVPSCFHSLKQLTIDGVNSGQPLLMILCNSYDLISVTIKNVEQLSCLSEPLLACKSLQLLKIRGCKELAELPPSLQSLRDLQTFEVIDCDSLISLPNIEGLLLLSKLEIVRCKNITSTPYGLEGCVSMEWLTLLGCPKLSFVPNLRSLNRLQSLCLSGFSKQREVPRWLAHLSCLSTLAIGGFNKKLDSICGIEQIPKCVRALALHGLPKLKSLPNAVQSLTQLRSLGLLNFEGVETLPEWLGDLSSLQVLGIIDCKNIKHLPSLDAMRRLQQLRELIIKRCPLLEERCSKDGSEEWHKISHISRIKINGNEAQCLYTGDCKFQSEE